MKKVTISVLLVLTLMFVAFICGMYVGRNSPYAQLQLNSSSTSSTLSTDPTSTNPNASDTKPTFPININTATAQELDLLPDIGPVRAQAIVDYRTKYGPFQEFSDLLNVKGIGKEILSKITPYITLGG